MGNVAAISDVKNGNCLVSLLLVVCWEDPLILGLWIHWYSFLLLLATPGPQKSRKDVSPAGSATLCNGNGMLWLRNVQELHPASTLEFLLALGCGCWLDMTIEKMCLRLLRKLRAN